MIQIVIDKISETGAFLTSIAFDGLKTNFAACKHFGASFDIENFRPFLTEPKTKRRISIVLDPPHACKLVRNCLAEKENLKDGDGRNISWKYFEDLVKNKSNLVSHRMTVRHIDFHSNRINVKLAAQTLSYSVARSMEVLKDNDDPSFLNCDGTVTFVKNFNKAFDIFNSKHSDSNNLFKRGLTEENAEKIFEFFKVFYHLHKITKIER